MIIKAKDSHHCGKVAEFVVTKTVGTLALVMHSGAVLDRGGSEQGDDVGRRLVVASRHVERRQPAEVDGARVGAVLQQEGDVVGTAVRGGHVQRSAARVVSHVEVGARLQPRPQRRHVVARNHTDNQPTEHDCSPPQRTTSVAFPRWGGGAQAPKSWLGPKI